MAEDSIDSPVTPEETKLGGVELRRHSTGKARSENSEEKVLPHYLRASTGSCHDFCKYGRNHAFEANDSHSIPKRVVRKPLRQSSEESVSRTKNLVAGVRASTDSKLNKKTSEVKLRASVDSKPSKKIPAVKLRASVDSKPEISVAFGTYDHKMPTKSLERSKIAEAEVQVNNLKKVKASNHVKSRTSDLPKTSQAISSIFMKVEASSNSTNVKAKEMKLFSKPNTVTGKKASPKNPSEGSRSRKDSEIKMEKMAASRKLVSPSRASFSLKPSLHSVASINARKLKSLKIVSPLKNQPETLDNESKQDIDVEVGEKTLYVIKMDGENKTLQSDQNASYDVESLLPQMLSSPKFSSSSSSRSLSQEDQEESEYTTSEAEDDSFPVTDEIEHIEDGENMEEEEEEEKKGMPRKKSVVCLEDKDFQTTKLKFIRGKWVEIKSDKSSPRRLKFRRGRELDNANGKDEAQRKSYKRRDEHVADGNDAVPAGPEMVVLRHQDVQGKKDEQGLFNNVIEETASKLVETRKSKVKALVGAFETVISLQEKKPYSANNVI